MSAVHDRAYDELLPDAALGWTDDATAYTALLQDLEARTEFEQLERTASLAALALATEDPRVHQADLVRLTTRLHADAVTYFAAARPTTPPLRPFREALPWLLAAASLVLLMWPRREAFVPTIDPVAARADLLLSRHELVQCAWQPGPSPRAGSVQGDVVWDSNDQLGYLRLRGLPELDPGHRYQLWIVDAERQGPPVDGGLLTLPRANGEVIVPVHSRLPVRRAAAFVLTIEPAVGVVVSAQEHVVAIAKP